LYNITVNQFEHILDTTAIMANDTTIAQRKAQAFLSASRPRVFIQPDIQRNAANLSLQMRLSFCCGQVALYNITSQTVLSAFHLQGHTVITAQVTHCFTQHCLYMCATVQNHTVRMTKLTGIRLTGGKV